MSFADKGTEPTSKSTAPDADNNNGGSAAAVTVPATSMPAAPAAADGAVATTKEGEETVKTEPPTPSVPWSELFRYADTTDKWLYAVGIFCSIVSGAGMPSFSYIFGALISELSRPPSGVIAGSGNVTKFDASQVNNLAFVMSMVGLARGVLGLFAVVCFMVPSERQTTKIRAAYLEALLRLDMAFHDGAKPGALTAHLVGDVQIFRNGINDKLGMGIIQLAMFFMGYGTAFYTNWRLSFVAVAMLPILIIVVLILRHFATKYHIASRDSFAKAGEVSDEAFQNFRTVQILGLEERLLQRFHDVLEQGREAGLWKDITAQLGVGSIFLVMFSSYALVFYYAVVLAIQGQLIVGEILTVFFTILIGSFGVVGAMPTLVGLIEASGAIAKVFAVIDRVPLIISGPRKLDGKGGGDDNQPALQGRITFENVSFVYPTKPDMKLFHNLTLDIEPGQHVAFSGASGCGKSSIIALVQRMYDPNEGRVLIDGVDINGTTSAAAADEQAETAKPAWAVAAAAAPAAPPAASSSSGFLPPIGDGSSLLVSPTKPSVHPLAFASPAVVASMALVPIAGTANLAAVAASVLTDVATRYRGTFTTQDVDVEQQRRAFIRVVEKVAAEAESCKSAAVFCEALFMHVRQVIESASSLARARTTTSSSSSAPSAPSSADDFAGLRIASACWALDVLSRSNTSFSFILTDIKRLLFPAVFVGYNAVEDACRQRAKAQPALAGSAALVSSAPYVVCDLFYQRYARDQRTMRQLTQSHETTTLKLQHNKGGAASILRTLNRQLIGTVFRAWNGYCHRQRVERFARAILYKSGLKESRSAKLDAAFSRWRLMVEQNRNATLSERCHHITHQLENAKGQFQLQCFRADKYLRVVEELREELRGARDIREELHKENIRLQAQLESFQVQARERLEAHVSMLCGELHKWKVYVAAQDREEKERIEASMKFCDRAHAAVRVAGALERTGSETPSTPPTTSNLDLSGAARAQSQIEIGSQSGVSSSWSAGGRQSVAAAAGAAAADDDESSSLMQQARDNTTKMMMAMDGTAFAADMVESTANLNFAVIASNVSSASSKSEAILLQWCTWAVQQCPLATIKAVTNFATDFINGEVILIVMNVAAPHIVSLGILQDVHPIRRLERAMDAGKKAGFTALPRVQDFAEGAADLIVLAVAEIFHMWCARSRLIAGDGEAGNSKDGAGADGAKGKKGRKAAAAAKKKAMEEIATASAASPLVGAGESPTTTTTTTTGGAAGNNKPDDDDEDELAATTTSNATAAAAAEAAAAAAAAAENAPPPIVRSEDLAKYLDDCQLALNRFRDSHLAAISRDRLLWRLELGALNRAAFIARERLEGRAVTVLDRKDMIRFIKFQKSRFNNLQNRYRMPPLDYNSPTPWMHFELQLDLLRESLHTHYADLRRCFTYYCNGAQTMSGAGYWSFCNDIRVVEPRVVSRQHLDRIFTMVNLEDISHALVDPLLFFEDDLLNEAAGADEDENTETQLIPSEFVECIIRIADLRVKDRMLHEKFALLMKEYVNLYACKSETDKFRREINSTAILAVTDRFKKDLHKIFVHFSHRKTGTGAGVTAAAAGKARAMSVADFVFFLKESYLYSPALDESAVQQIFNNVASPTDDMSGRELQSHEFVDAIVCCSFYKQPSPFTHLEKKIELTCSGLIQYLRGRLKGLVLLGGGGGGGGKEASLPPGSPKEL